MALELIRVKVPASFNPANKTHISHMIERVAQEKGPGWEVQSYDAPAQQLTLARTSALTEVAAAGNSQDSFEVSLGMDVKASEGERTAQRLEADNPGFYLTEFRPHVKRARLTRMNEAEVRCRDAICGVIGVPRWEVQVKQRRDKGFAFEVSPRYSPGKHDLALQEVAEVVVGRPGWYVKIDPKTLKGDIIPAEQPTFEPVYHYDFSSLPMADKVPDKDLFKIPLGVALGGNGQPNRPFDMDLSDSVGALMVGLAGSGKAQPLSTRIPVPTQDRFPDGWATIGGLEIGDLVYAGDGSATAVVGFTEAYEADVWEVVLSDGQVVRTHENHVWKASNVFAHQIHTPKLVRQRKSHRDERLARARGLRDLAAKNGPGVGADLADIARMAGFAPAVLKLMDLPLEHLAKQAVLYGQQFGSGHGVTVYPVDEALTLIAERLEQEATEGHRNRPAMPAQTLVTTGELRDSLKLGQVQNATWAVHTAGSIEGSDTSLPLPSYTLGAGMGGGFSKFGDRIAAEYLRASHEQRLALLQGFMDSQGDVNSSGSCEIVVSRHSLAHDVLELVRSLGIKAHISNDDEYRITFHPPHGLEQGSQSTRPADHLLYVTDVRQAGREMMRCISVAHPDHQYLTDGFVPTHNSVTVQSVIYSAKARGFDLGVITTVDKATDFMWAKPYVADHLWGCDSVAQAVAVAKLVGERGEHMGRLLSEHRVSKWQDLPASVRKENPPLLLVADELAALLTADPLPSGLSKEMKELPEFLQMQQDLLESKLLATSLSKIPAVYRAAGIRVVYLTQQPNERYGFSTKLKGNLPHRVMLGVSPSQAEKGHAFRTPEKVPDVPTNIAQDNTVARGVGLAHLDGQEPVVFKGFFAPLDTYVAEAKRRRFPTTTRPEPTPGQIARLVPRLDGDADGGDLPQQGFGLGPRVYQPWELDADGRPLQGYELANATRAEATRLAKQTAG